MLEIIKLKGTEMIKKMFGILLVPSIGYKICYFSTKPKMNQLLLARKGINIHLPDKLTANWMLRWLNTVYLRFFHLVNTTDVWTDEKLLPLNSWLTRIEYTIVNIYHAMFTHVTNKIQLTLCKMDNSLKAFLV